MWIAKAKYSKYMNKTKSPCIPCGRKWPHSRKQLLQPRFLKQKHILYVRLSVVGGLEHYIFFHSAGNNNPIWLSYFLEGLKPPTRWLWMIMDDYWWLLNDFWSLLIDCWGLSVSTFGSVLVFHRFPSLFSHQITELDLGHPGTPSRAASRPTPAGHHVSHPAGAAGWWMDMVIH